MSSSKSYNSKSHNSKSHNSKKSPSLSDFDKKVENTYNTLMEKINNSMQITPKQQARMEAEKMEAKKKEKMKEEKLQKQIRDASKLQKPSMLGKLFRTIRLGGKGKGKGKGKKNNKSKTRKNK